MDEFTTGYREGWTECAHAAEDFSVLVFLPSGKTAKAVLVNDLVRLRQMPEAARGSAG